MDSSEASAFGHAKRKHCAFRHGVLDTSAFDVPTWDDCTQLTHHDDDLGYPFWLETATNTLGADSVNRKRGMLSFTGCFTVQKSDTPVLGVRLALGSA